MSRDEVMDRGPGWVGRTAEPDSAIATPRQAKVAPLGPCNVEDSPDLSDPLQTKVPDGRYSVAYLSDESAFAFGRKVCFVRFAIVEPSEYHGLILLRFVNLPKQWQGKKRGQKARSLARSSTLALDYMSIHGRIPPTRIFSPADLYKDRLLLVKVVKVGVQNIDGERVQVPTAGQYSKISRVIRQEAGA